MPAEPDPSLSLPLSHSEHGARHDKLHEPKSFRQFGRWLRDSISRKPEASLKEALEEVLEEHEDEAMAVSPEERNLLRNMIAFADLRVGDVAIPRNDIAALPETATPAELKAHILEHRHTRIPLYSGTIDNITGFVHVKDVCFNVLENIELDVAAVTRQILFVPPSMKIMDLIVKMRLSTCHIAIVVDEYGCTDGLVTMEDMFEEVFGEIQDEHDEDEEYPGIYWISERTLEADARVKVSALEEELQLDLFADDEDQEDFDTLGGMISSHLGRVPAKGEVVHFGRGIELEILAADPCHIKKVRVVRTGPAVPVDA